VIKRILVGLGTSGTARAVTEHAVDIALPRAAALTGLAVTDVARLEWTGPRPMGVGVEAATADLRRQRFERAAADVVAAADQFATRCRAAGVAHRVSEETGDALERLVADGVRPILAVGEEFRPIRRVLVAYSGSLESAKTFKHFVQSGLFAEAPVRIVHFGDDAETAGRRLEKSAAYFAAHGRQVDTDHAAGDPARELIPYAEAWGADLVVAGNSAKNLLLRRLFGETALRLLHDSPLPLYLAQ
jgi:nucleotide-binding universal stress UspA family protein